MSADDLRRQGNELYAQGDYQNALELYMKSNAKQNGTLTFSNISQCFIMMSKWPEAIAAARSAIELDPLNHKARTRLLRAAGETSCVDFCQLWDEIILRAFKQDVPTRGNNALKESTEWQRTIPGYSEILGHLAEVSKLALGTIRLIAPGDTIPARGECSVAVLLPGTHTYEMSCPAVMVGVGKVVLKAAFPVVSDFNGRGGTLALARMTISSESSNMPACAAFGSTLLMDEVTINCANSGTLSDGGCLFLRRSTVRSCKQACVEVRNGGSAIVLGCTLADSNQGVVGYAGATAVHMETTSIKNMRREGVLLAGTVSNQATAMQAKLIGREDFFEGNDVARQANFFAPKDKNLIASIVNCDVSLCKEYPVSLDSGAQVAMAGTRVDAPQTAMCVFIKGGTSVSVVNYCLIGKVGVHVAVNYEGDVIVQNTVFVTSSQAILEERIQSGKLMERLGAQSKAVCAAHNTSCESAAAAPPMSAIRGRGVIPLERSSPQTFRELVPKLGHAIFFNDYESHYPIGNTEGFCGIPSKIFESSDNTESIRVLFAGCGDIRNLLATAVVAQHAARPLSVHLLDVSTEILARDFLLLWMILNDVSLDVIVSVWGNFYLDAEASKCLGQTLTTLKGIASPPAWAEPMSLEQLALLKNCWSSWCAISPEAARGAMGFFHACPLALRLEILPAKLSTLKKHKDELNSYFSPAPTSAVPNVTMFCNNGQFRAHPNSCIFRAVTFAIDKDKTLRAALTASVAIQVAALRLIAANGRLTISFTTGDLSEEMMPNSAVKYDWIDLSNCCDYLSITTCLVAAMGATHSTSVLTMQLMRSRKTRSIAWEKSLPCSIEVFQYVTGMSVTSRRCADTDVTFLCFSPNSKLLDSMTPARRFLEILGAARQSDNGLLVSDQSTALTFFALCRFVLPQEFQQYFVSSVVMRKHEDALTALRFDTPNRDDVMVSQVQFVIQPGSYYLIANTVVGLRVVAFDKDMEPQRIYEGIEYQHSTGFTRFLSKTLCLPHTPPGWKVALQAKQESSVGEWATVSNFVPLSAVTLKPFSPSIPLREWNRSVMVTKQLDKKFNDWELRDLRYTSPTLCCVDIQLPQTCVGEDVEVKKLSIRTRMSDGGVSLTTLRIVGNESIGMTREWELPATMMTTASLPPLAFESDVIEMRVWKRFQVLTLVATSQQGTTHTDPNFIK